MNGSSLSTTEYESTLRPPADGVLGHPSTSPVAASLDGAGAGRLPLVPRPRPHSAEASPNGARPSADTTVVLPHASSRGSRRTRWLRAWMLTAPVDLAALLTPLLLTDRYWRGTLFAAGLTVVIFATGGLYRGRRHMSILDELPSLRGHRGDDRRGAPRLGRLRGGLPARGRLVRRVGACWPHDHQGDRGRRPPPAVGAAQRHHHRERTGRDRAGTAAAPVPAVRPALRRLCRRRGPPRC